MARKTGKQRGGSTTGRKTTARRGTSKSAKARARSQRSRSSAAGRAGASPGKSRTMRKPARPRRLTNRGPGDVGKRKDRSVLPMKP